MTAVRDGIRCKTDATLEAVQHLDGPLAKKIKTAKRLAFEFSGRLCNRPVLSTVPVEEWPIPRYQLLFDDLSTLEREFQRLGDFDLPGEHQTPATVTRVTNTPPGADANAEVDGEPPTAKRGRRKGSVDSNPEKDRKLAEAWKKGQGNYRCLQELATESRMDLAELKAALDRNRKR